MTRTLSTSPTSATMDWRVLDNPGLALRLRCTTAGFKTINSVPMTPRDDCRVPGYVTAWRAAVSVPIMNSRRPACCTLDWNAAGQVVKPIAGEYNPRWQRYDNHWKSIRTTINNKICTIWKEEKEKRIVLMVAPWLDTMSPIYPKIYHYNITYTVSHNDVTGLPGSVVLRSLDN